MDKEKQILQGVPPWVQHFLIHVVKRSASVLITWIEDVREANREAVKVIDQAEIPGYNGQKK